MPLEPIIEEPAVTKAQAAVIDSQEVVASGSLSAAVPGPSSFPPPPAASVSAEPSSKRSHTLAFEDPEHEPSSVPVMGTPRRRLLKFGNHSVHTMGVEIYEFAPADWVTQNVIRTSSTEILSSPGFVTRNDNIITLRSTAYEPQSNGHFRSEVIQTQFDLMTAVNVNILPTVVVAEGHPFVEDWARNDLPEFFEDNVLDTKGSSARLDQHRIGRDVAVRVIQYITYQMTVCDYTYVFFILYAHASIAAHEEATVAFQPGHARFAYANLYAAGVPAEAAADAITNAILGNHLVLEWNDVTPPMHGALIALITGNGVWVRNAAVRQPIAMTFVLPTVQVKLFGPAARVIPAHYARPRFIDFMALIDLISTYYRCPGDQVRGWMLAQRSFHGLLVDEPAIEAVAAAGAAPPVAAAAARTRWYTAGLATGSISVPRFNPYNILW